MRPILPAGAVNHTVPADEAMRLEPERAQLNQARAEGQEPRCELSAAVERERAFDAVSAEVQAWLDCRG